MMNRVDHSNVNRWREVPYPPDIEVFDRASATSVSVGEHNYLRGGFEMVGNLRRERVKREAARLPARIYRHY